MTEIVLENAASPSGSISTRAPRSRIWSRPVARTCCSWGDWRSPLPAPGSQSYGNQALDWLSSYRGGWQELFPNAGGCRHGARHAASVPRRSVAHAVAAEWHEPGRDVTLSLARACPLVISRRMRLDPVRPVLVFEETIANESGLPVPYIWGHHPAFGPPLAATGARIDLPAAG